MEKYTTGNCLFQHAFVFPTETIDTFLLSHLYELIILLIMEFPADWLVPIKNQSIFGENMKILTLSILTLSLTASLGAHAADIIQCSFINSPNNLSTLNVREEKSGYIYEVSHCLGLAHADCTAYTSQGPIERDIARVMGHEFPATTFAGYGKKIFHLFGAYAFVDSANGIDIRFPDESCVLAPSDPKVVVGRGELGDGIFGDCTSPYGTGYLYRAKAIAAGNAVSQCPTHRATRLGEFQVSSECKDNNLTAVARAIYRCEK